MIVPAVACLLLNVILRSGVVLSFEWHYGDEAHWPSLCKEGRKQSPIALSKSIAEEVEYSAFIFERYYADYPVQSKNNGHSAEIRLHVRDQPSVRGGGLPEVYVLDHLHFHWESEHVMDGYRFPLELHLVHYASIYNNVSHALNYRDGVAVFSVLFDLSPDDDREFEPLITVIDKLHDKVDKIEQLTFNIQDYLPRDTAGFYRYNGSLTTPNCTEGVIWTVFTNTLPISKNQVRSFTQLQTKERKELPHNYRPLQSLNGRRVFLRVSPIRNGAEGHKQATKSFQRDKFMKNKFYMPEDIKNNFPLETSDLFNAIPRVRRETLKTPLEIPATPMVPKHLSNFAQSIINIPKDGHHIPNILTDPFKITQNIPLGIPLSLKISNTPKGDSKPAQNIPLLHDGVSNIGKLPGNPLNSVVDPTVGVTNIAQNIPTIAGEILKLPKKPLDIASSLNLGGLL